MRPSTRSRRRDLPSLHANLKAEHEIEKNLEEDYALNINGPSAILVEGRTSVAAMKDLSENLFKSDKLAYVYII